LFSLKRYAKNKQIKRIKNNKAEKIFKKHLQKKSLTCLK